MNLLPTENFLGALSGQVPRLGSSGNASGPEPAGLEAEFFRCLWAIDPTLQKGGEAKSGSSSLSKGWDLSQQGMAPFPAQKRGTQEAPLKTSLVDKKKELPALLSHAVPLSAYALAPFPRDRSQVAGASELTLPSVRGGADQRLMELFHSSLAPSFNHSLKPIAHVPIKDPSNGIGTSPKDDKYGLPGTEDQKVLAQPPTQPLSSELLAMHDGSLYSRLNRNASVLPQHGLSSVPMALKKGGQSILSRPKRGEERRTANADLHQLPSLSMPITSGAHSLALGPHDLGATLGKSDSNFNAHTQQLPMQELQHATLQLVHKGGGQIRIHLNPPELGQVHIQVEHSAKGIAIAIHPEEKHTGTMLQSQLSELKSALEHASVRIRHLEVHESGFKDTASFSSSDSFAPKKDESLSSGSSDPFRGGGYGSHAFDRRQEHETRSHATEAMATSARREANHRGPLSSGEGSSRYSQDGRLSVWV